MCSKKTYTEEQIAEMRSFLPDYLMNHCGVRSLKGNFRCVIPSHEDSTASMQYNEGSKTVFCHGCGEAWNVFQLVGKVEGIERFPEQLERVAQLRGMQPEGEWEGPPKAFTKKPKQYDKPEPITGPNVWEAVFEAYTKLYEPEARHALEYLYSRGFDDAEIVAYGWGWCSHPSEVMEGFEYAKHRKEGYICLPHPESASWEAVRFCTFRPLFHYGAKKELKPSGMPSALWHEYLLGIGERETVCICEGVFDSAALSKIVGLPAVSLNGTGRKRLVDTLAHTPQRNRPRIMLCLDSDEKGREASAALLKDLKALGVCVAEMPPFPEGVKDGNDLLLWCGANER